LAARVVQQIDLAHREVVGRAPVFVDQAQFVGAQHCHRAIVGCYPAPYLVPGDARTAAKSLYRRKLANDGGALLSRHLERFTANVSTTGKLSQASLTHMCRSCLRVNLPSNTLRLGKRGGRTPRSVVEG
jgi:hypothetical protein